MVREVFHGKGTSRYFETLDEIEKVWQRAKPEERQSIRDFIKVNTEHKTAGAKQVVQVWALRVTYYLGIEHLNKRILTGAWGFKENPGWTKGSWEAYLGNNAGPRNGLTANQIRKVVGLPPIKERAPTPKSKTNPMGLRSRSAGAGGVSLGKVLKPRPKAKTSLRKGYKNQAKPKPRRKR